MAAPSITAAVDLSGAPATMSAPLWTGVTSGTTLTVASNQWRAQVGSASANGTYGGRIPFTSTENLTNWLITFRAVLSAINGASDFGGSLTSETWFMVALMTSAGNGRRWKIGSGSSETSFGLCIDPSQTSTMQSEIGTFDITSVVALEFHFNKSSGANVEARVGGGATTSRVWSIPKTGVAITGGEVGNLATFDIVRNTNPYAIIVDNLGADALKTTFPIEFKPDKGLISQYYLNKIKAATDGSDDFGAIHLAKADNKILIAPASGGDVEVDSSYFLGGEETKLEFSGAGDIDQNSCSIQEFEDVDFLVGTHSNIILNGFTNSTVDTDIRASSFSSSETVEIDIEDVDTLLELDLSGALGEINLSISAGDYSSSLILDLNDGFVINLNSSAGGAYTFTGLSGGTIGDPIIFDAIDGEDYTIILGFGIVAEVADPVTSGTVTLQSPQGGVDLEVSGPSDYYVTIVQGTTRLNTSDTGLQSGSYSFSTDTTGSATVRVRRQGWAPFSTTVTLVSGVPVSVNAELSQETDAFGAPLYEGTTTSICTIDIEDRRVDIGNGSVQLQTVYDMLEDAIVSADGMRLWTGAEVSYNYARVQPLVRALSLPSALKVRRRASGDSQAGIVGYIAHADDAVLDTTNGSVNFVQSLGLTAQEIRDAMALALTVGTTIGTDSIDDKIDAVPTTAEFEARTLPSASYFDPATDAVANVTTVGTVTNPVTAGTVSDKTGYSLTQAFPANFATLAIDGSGQVTTSNPGGGASAADVWGYTGGDRALTGTQAANLAAIPSIPTNPLLTTDSRLNNLDATISSRLASASYTTPDNAGIAAILEDTGTTLPATLAGLSTLTSGDIATALTTYTVPTLAQVEAAGFTTTRHNALIAADLAARALADGRYEIDYTASTATQYDPNGTVRTVFDQLDADDNPATSAQTAVKRVPQ